MLTIFGCGAAIAIGAIVGLLRLTMREEPTGCLLIFGSIFFLLLASVVFTMW